MNGDDDRPTFSVIIIFHNEERFLAEAVASVAAQTGPSWELIMVDDGSTDQSAHFARVLATAFPTWMRCITHPGRANLGMSASRNLGLDHARGEFVTFLDADDVWRPGKLDAQLKLLRSHPDVGVLVAPAEWWWSWDGGDEDRDHRQCLLPVDQDEVVVASPPQLARHFLIDEWKSICDLVVSRQLANLVGGYEGAFTAMFEDQVFHTKLLSQHPALVAGRHWYRYRQHGDACTATSHDAGTHAVSRRRFLDWAVGYLAVQTKPAACTDEQEWSDYVNLVRRQRRRAVRIETFQRMRARLGSTFRTLLRGWRQR